MNRIKWKEGQAMPRILLVDDDDALRGTLRRILRRAGHSTVEASDGRDALAALETGDVDLVITDLIMPTSEGLDLILALGRDRPSLPVIAMSGGGRLQQGDLLAKARLLGAVTTLEKPFDGERLLAAVRDATVSAPGHDAYRST